jgi:hypothetical protein
MSGADQMVLLIAGLHLFALIGVALLILPALRDIDERPPGGTDTDDGGGRGPGGPRLIPPRPSGGLPLPDAVPAGVRLRDHTRLGGKLPARQRRPAREPERTPRRTPA